MIRPFLALISLSFATNVHAFTCFITMIKDSCWTNYNVTVNVTDAASGKVITTVIVPSGSSWDRQKFTCQPQQKLSFHAEFNPVFWEKEKGKTYNGLNYWTLPDEVTGGDTAWNINVCYPKQFAEVPFPPEGTHTCACDTSQIPPIPPQ